MNPTILYQDEDIIVINKPAGLIVNKADTTRHEITLQDWVEKELAINNEQLTKINESEFYRRGGIVHRLDKETSGVLIIAKTQKAFEDLQRQFKERQVKKVYRALVHGNVAGDSGEVNVPIGRLPWNRMRFGVLPEGRASVTKFSVLKRFEKNKQKYTFLEVYPETGRTHQIRVHAKHIGHPIVSDKLYAGRKTSRDDRKFLPRLFLHAVRISFTHPTTGKQLSLAAPMPEELNLFIPE